MVQYNIVDKPYFFTAKWQKLKYNAENIAKYGSVLIWENTGKIKTIFWNTLHSVRMIR